MDVRSPFSEWLRHRRKLLDMTQTELAKKVGCSAVTIRKLEGSERKPSRQLAEGLAKVLRVPEREHAAFVQFARSRPTAGGFQLPAWDAEKITWRSSQLPHKPIASQNTEPGTILHYDLIAKEKPIMDTLDDGRTLVHVEGIGDVSGALEGRIQVYISQVLVPKPQDMNYAQALSTQIGARFKVSSGEDFLEGSYVGTMYPMIEANGNGQARVLATGHVIRVSKGLVGYYLNHVFVEDEVKMVEGLGTGASGTMRFEHAS